MALIAMGGWKERDPILSYYDLASEEDSMPLETVVPVGLHDVAYHGALDPERKIIYTADDSRIKSYDYGGHDDFIPKHTLSSSGRGPLALFDHGGKLLHAARGKIEVWDIDSQPTHGSDGDSRIGKKISTENSSRDNDCDEIERSAGSKPTSVIQLQNNLSISKWASKPGGTEGQMLVAPDSGFEAQRLWSVDINAGDTPISRYLGHSGAITQISTSALDDPNSFLTACRDGIARLYDIREPLPKLSFDVGCAGEPITSALYVHVEGVPGKGGFALFLSIY
jgi:WD40 repeat protein